MLDDSISYCFCLYRRDGKGILTAQVGKELASSATAGAAAAARPRRVIVTDFIAK